MRQILDVTPSATSSYPGHLSYPVYAGANAPLHLAATWQPRWRHAVVVSDLTTRRLFADEIAESLTAKGIPVLACTFSPGEHQKTRATKAAIEDRMLAAGIDRNACIVAVGGGVVLDVAGFVAATFMRGVAHVNVATTLLAQVDAAIGGKTAINTEHGKNLIGAVHHPRAVLLATDALTHLPDVELRCGLAEAVKHAVLSDAALFDELAAWAPQGAGLIPPAAIIERCVAIKAEVVAADDRDHGKRNILNYGHTAAHAIEHATDHDTPHGYAVAMGMLVEARLAAQSGRFPVADVTRLEALLDGFGLPTAPACSFEAAEPFLTRDKKTVSGKVQCAIPRRIGETVPEKDGSWTRAVTAAQMGEAWLP